MCVCVCESDTHTAHMLTSFLSFAWRFVIFVLLPLVVFIMLFFSVSLFIFWLVLSGLEYFDIQKKKKKIWNNCLHLRLLLIARIVLLVKVEKK